MHTTGIVTKKIWNDSGELKYDPAINWKRVCMEETWQIEVG